MKREIMTNPIYKVAINYSKILKTAQSASNPEFDSLVDQMTQPFIVNLFNAAQNAPEGAMEIGWDFQIAYLKTGFNVTPTVPKANTPQIKTWAEKVLINAKPNYIIKLNEILKQYNSAPISDTKKFSNIVPIYNTEVYGIYKA